MAEVRPTVSAGGSRPDAARRDAGTTRFRALADVARVATTTSGLPLLREVAVAALRALDGASVSLSRWEPDTGLVRCLLNAGDLASIEEPEPTDEVYSIHDYPGLVTLVEDLAPLVASVGQEDGAGYARMLDALGKGSCVAAPIPLDGRVWGELFVTRTLDQAPFTIEDGEFAVALAAQVGAAIATAEYLTRVEREARTDPLTGLANRRAVDDRLDQAFQRRLQENSPVGLVVCDLNGLKQLNDDQGHAAGDRALVRFAGLLATVASRLPGALAARLGGDEFCLVVEDAPADAVVAAAEELCHLVLRSTLEGVACGVACTQDEVGDVTEPSRLLRLADAAQYRAKRSRSPLPVVAGRTLPAQAALGLADPPPTDRRRFRGGDGDGAGRLLERGLAALEDCRPGGVRERLSVVGDLVGHQVDALGWWLSRQPPGTDVAETVQFALYRSNPLITTEAPSTNAVGAQFPLGEYPATAAVLAGGAVHVETSDPAADPAEVALLDGMGAVALLMAGSRDHEGVGWLLEVFGDDLSGQLSPLVAAARSLVAVAVGEGGRTGERG